MATVVNVLHGIASRSIKKISNNENGTIHGAVGAGFRYFSERRNYV